MKTIPVPVRLDKNVQKLLREGARRTPHKKQELIRLTLRRHLREVIEEEALVKTTPRVTNIEPWPKRVVEAAYRRMGRDWDGIEDAATRAQGRPDFND
jgi:CRISPR/Cas system-associated protein Csm6